MCILSQSMEVVDPHSLTKCFPTYQLLNGLYQSLDGQQEGGRRKLLSLQDQRQGKTCWLAHSKMFVRRPSNHPLLKKLGGRIVLWSSNNNRLVGRRCYSTNQ